MMKNDMKMKNGIFVLALLFLLCLDTTKAQTVGDTVKIEGYIMDQFCIQRGNFLDHPEINSLEHPQLHTVHCLMDPPPCIGSPFEILTPPPQGKSAWNRSFTLDDQSKRFIVEMIKVVGGPGCMSCKGIGNLDKGFQARMTATILDMGNRTSGAGPTISVEHANPILPEPEGMNYAVGDTFTIEGFISDRFCLERGTFLDKPNVSSILFPNLHTAHCLLDPPPCINSPYEILIDARPGEMEYRRAFTLSNNSKTEIVTVARSLGGCDTCDNHTGDGRYNEGFRTEIAATVLEVGANTTVVNVTNITPVIYITDATTQVRLKVGDRVTVIGFIMDNFCIKRGTFLDKPEIMALKDPQLHTFHCLLDVVICNQSKYEVLLDPPPGSGENYTRGFVLDDNAKTMAQSIARNVGICKSCNGTGSWDMGFRAKVYGTVLELGKGGGPPLISASMVEPWPLLNTDMIPAESDAVTSAGGNPNPTPGNPASPASPTTLPPSGAPPGSQVGSGSAASTQLVSFGAFAVSVLFLWFF